MHFVQQEKGKGRRPICSRKLQHMQAQKSCRGIMPCNINISACWKWMVSFTSRPLYPRGWTPVSIEQEVLWVPEPVWTFRRRVEHLVPAEIVQSIAFASGKVAVLSPKLSARKLFCPQAVLSARCSVRKLFFPQGVLSASRSVRNLFCPQAFLTLIIRKRFSG